MDNITLCAIVAMAQNRVIGKDNTLIWHLPADLKHFKRTTLGKPIIMGRKSYDSLGKPLPGRPNIVISRSLNKPEENTNEGPFLYVSIEKAIEAAHTHAQTLKTDEIFIIGGGEIYKQTLPIIQRLYLTILHRDYDGDTMFPEVNWDKWTIASEEKHPENTEKNNPPFSIYKLDKK